MRFLPPEVSRSLRRKSTSLKHKQKVIRDLMHAAVGVERDSLICEILMDRRFDAAVRSRAVWEVGSHPGLELVRCLRIITHDKSEPRELRERTLYELVVVDTTLAPVDIRSLLLDPDEDPIFRGEAAEKICMGDCVEELASTLKMLLREPNLHEEIAFWCIYACHELCGDEEVAEILKLYLDDHRVVRAPVGVPHTDATVAQEAAWALDQIAGNYSDPAWLIV